MTHKSYLSAALASTAIATMVAMAGCMGANEDPDETQAAPGVQEYHRRPHRMSVDAQAPGRDGGAGDSLGAGSGGAPGTLPGTGGAAANGGATGNSGAGGAKGGDVVQSCQLCGVTKACCSAVEGADANCPFSASTCESLDEVPRGYYIQNCLLFIKSFQGAQPHPPAECF